MRGAVSTGFRAPGLQQEFFTSTATNFIGGVPFEVGTFPATRPPPSCSARSRSTPRNRPTIRWVPCCVSANFEATIDAYRIDIDDRIVLSENLNTPQVAALIAPFGASVARFFINGVETKTEGVDLVARYLLQHGRRGHASSSSPQATGTTPTWRACPRPNVIDNICVGQPAPCTPPVLFGRINTLTFENGTPDSKISLGIDWSIPVGVFELRRESQGHAVRRGDRARRSPTPPRSPPGSTMRATSYIEGDALVDLALTAKFMDDKLGFMLGADNLFDQYPDRVPNNRVLPLHRAEP